MVFKSSDECVLSTGRSCSAGGSSFMVLASCPQSAHSYFLFLKFLNPTSKTRSLAKTRTLSKLASFKISKFCKNWVKVGPKNRTRRARALKAINSWNLSPTHALAMNRHILGSHFGHLASLVWAKLILGRFPDAVLPDFSRFPAGSDDYLNTFFTDPHHGRYCGRYFPGA